MYSMTKIPNLFGQITVLLEVLKLNMEILQVDLGEDIKPIMQQFAYRFTISI